MLLVWGRANYLLVDRIDAALDSGASEYTELIAPGHCIGLKLQPFKTKHPTEFNIYRQDGRLFNDTFSKSLMGGCSGGKGSRRKRYRATWRKLKASESSYIGQEKIVVEHGKYKTYYPLGFQIDKRFLVAAIDPQCRQNNSTSGFHSSFVTFSASATRTYMKKYAGTTHCPTEFLNRHADYISLYAANSEIEKKLETLKLKTAADISKWKFVKINGQCLGGNTEGKVSRNCQMIHVTKINQLDTNVKNYMGRVIDLPLIICLLWGLFYGVMWVFNRDLIWEVPLERNYHADYYDWYASNAPKGLWFLPVIIALFWSQNGQRVSSNPMPDFVWERILVTLVALFIGFAFAKWLRPQNAYS